jgi:hypothetical protein
LWILRINLLLIGIKSLLGLALSMSLNVQSLKSPKLLLSLDPFRSWSPFLALNLPLSLTLLVSRVVQLPWGKKQFPSLRIFLSPPRSFSRE